MNKVRENKARRMAARQGLDVSKSPRRDPLATDFGTWTIRKDSEVVAIGVSLDELERRLSRGNAGR